MHGSPCGEVPRMLPSLRATMPAQSPRCRVAKVIVLQDPADWKPKFTSVVNYQPALEDLSRDRSKPPLRDRGLGQLSSLAHGSLRRPRVDGVAGLSLTFLSLRVREICRLKN